VKVSLLQTQNGGLVGFMSSALSSSISLPWTDHIHYISHLCYLYPLKFLSIKSAVWNSPGINTRSAKTFLAFRRKLKNELLVKSYNT